MVEFVSHHPAQWRRGGPGAKAALLYAFLAIALVVAPPTQAEPRFSAIVVDAVTGNALHEIDADLRSQPASLTKMMTLYLVFEALEQHRLRLDQGLRVSAHAASRQASRLGLRSGQTIRVQDAILATVTKSANDAAVVLAEAVGGTESSFARMMNLKARLLGMVDTGFCNASGLPDEQQFSTPRDMMRLARALLQHFPQYYRLFSVTEFTYKGRTFRNHNHLLGRYPGSDGIKTGYVRASGFNLVASAVRDDRRLVAVIFGGKTPGWRDRHMVTLLNDGFIKLTAGANVASVGPLPGTGPGVKAANR